MLVSGCAEFGPESEKDDAGDGVFGKTGIDEFDVTSEDLHDGVWDTVITNTGNGDNVSPQLSWEGEEDAVSYVIYMIDTSAENWIHWKSNDVTETELPRGWASSDEYIGPYPPSGTHDYEIYVVALKKPVTWLQGEFDAADPDFAEHLLLLDIAYDGSSGNMIGYGHIKGTYTNGD